MKMRISAMGRVFFSMFCAFSVFGICEKFDLEFFDGENPFFLIFFTENSWHQINFKNICFKNPW